MTISYDEICRKAMIDESYREGLRDAAKVCRAQGTGEHSCPSYMAAVYLDRLANGEQP